MSLFRTFLAFVLVSASTATFAASPALAAPTGGVQAKKSADKPADKKTEKTGNGATNEMSETLAKQCEEFFNKLTTIVVDNKRDCARMAAAVHAHIDENQALLQQLHEAKSQHKALPQQRRNRIAKKSAEQLGPAMMARCGNDRAVMEAFLRIKAAAK